MVSLTRLSLWWNHLIEMPDVSALTLLEELPLSFNFLDAMPVGIGSHARIVDVGHNKLPELPGALLQECAGLEELHAYCNKLTALPPQIGELQNLQKLMLGDNAITELVPELWSLAQLRVLDLSQNQLTVISGDIRRATSLEVLFLAGNKLTILPNELCNLALRRVNFRDNPLDMQDMVTKEVYFSLDERCEVFVGVDRRNAMGGGIVTDDGTVVQI